MIIKLSGPTGHSSPSDFLLLVAVHSPGYHLVLFMTVFYLCEDFLHVFCVYGPSFSCTAPGLLPSIGADLIQVLCRPQKLLCEHLVFQGELVSAVLAGAWAMAASTAASPTSASLFCKGELLPSSGFGKVAPFPGRSSSIKGAFCNETEAGQSFVKVSVRLTPRAQEQVFRLLIPPPVSINKPLIPDVSFYCP